MYSKLDKLIPTLEKNFPNILGEILNYDHQKHDAEQGQSQSLPAISS